ncbi:MAG TPA: adenylate/guanylate cyclase domain-containing protein [Bacteroidales bacterium]
MLNKMVLWFIPSHYFDDEEALRKAKLFVITSIITFFFSFFYFYTAKYSFNMPTVAKGQFFNTIAYLILPFLYRTNWLNHNVMVFLFFIFGLTGVSIDIFYLGGLSSSVLPWYAIPPIAALMMSNKKIGWFWAIFSYLFITFIGYLTYTGFEFHNELAPELSIISHTTNLSGLVMLIFLIALVFENTKNRALKNLADKNEQLDKEKQRSDHLLQNILPLEIMEELKDKGSSEAKYFEHVTVLFSDFVNFTKIGETMSPQELVEELNFYFKKFDEIITIKNLEKIKTIGDAYMATGGLNTTLKAEPENVILAAIEMQEVVAKRKIERAKINKPAFDMRIGIHTGPVVAGIVGVKKFTYDIWGDTVNTASRFEAESAAGKINISQQTYELVKDKFECEYRGKIQAKNKGAIDMYFVKTKIGEVI